MNKRLAVITYGLPYVLLARDGAGAVEEAEWVRVTASA